MDKIYNPKKIEIKYRKLWEENKCFSSEYNNLAKNSYCIMLPPPNVTGSLHMGHAFQHTIMDILTRYHRMSGKQTLWQAGTDHAGIATQMVVERQLAEQNITKNDLSREEFIQKIWQWKQESGDTISKQMRRLGASVDWQREKFTMDEDLSSAVSKVFIKLYNEGLIYRGKRLINWDPVLKTALSDLEVIATEEEGLMYYVRYPFVTDNGFMEIATTRPETILADGALAVNPKDKRYKNVIGKLVWVPMTKRKIPIIADDYVDMEFGTGCVKITPAHDFNDWEVGKRHKMEVINLFTPDAKLNANAPKAYQNLERFEARQAIVKDLDDAKLLITTKKHRLTPPRGDRSGAILEPFLTDQWFVKVAPLAKPAIDAVKNGDTKFVPSNWEKTYFNWMNNIQDWCISRQIIWGHRIPAWYDENGEIFVANTLQEAKQQAIKKGGNGNLVQDNDVLDTWFSSALWPFSTLGWQGKDENKTPELSRFYPTSVLVTGFDIIFFWVARMIMFGLKFTGEVPFKDIYITGLIRDNNGQKMSKSKGNVIDPIDIIDGISLDELIKKRTYGLMQPQMKEKIIKNTKKTFPDGIQAFGTDAMRWTFSALASFGRDIKFDLSRVAGYRNFCNKLWNASRFVLMNVEPNIINDNTNTKLSSIDKWILYKLQIVIKDSKKHITEYRFDLMAQVLYDFVWHDYCDWYLEFAKVLLTKEAMKINTQKTLFNVLNEILKLLHPVIPFITEEIFSDCNKIINANNKTLSQTKYPIHSKHNKKINAIHDVNWIQEFILGIRQIRGETNIAPNKKLNCLLFQYNANDEKLLIKYSYLIKSIAKITNIELLSKNQQSPKSATALIGETKILVPLSGLIDKEQELNRLQKEITKLAKQKQQSSNKLNNTKFINNAPNHIVKKEMQKLEQTNKKLSNLNVEYDKINQLK